ncbi:MAG: N-formylglutamate amidohydrolase [Pseudomonadota bacterium]
MPDAYTLHHPSGTVLPIVIDSPHSGTRWPADAEPALGPQRLREAEDAFVDQLYARAPALGAVLLKAEFARAYIDPNRSLLDIDEALLDAPWPGPAEPSAKSELGIGLVWRLLDGQPLYTRRLTVKEVQHRIDTCWRPYHRALQQQLEAAYRRFGARWHLDVHSMPDASYRLLGLPDRPLADFVLGDRNGSTADEATMRVLEQSLRASGFSVARNDPFKGVEIVRLSGDPARRCHAVQVEVKKSLYMDVAAHRPHAGFERVRQALERMLSALADHVRQELTLQRER